MVFQKQLSEGKFALVSCEELLDFANQTLTINTEEEFLAVRRDEDKEDDVISSFKKKKLKMFFCFVFRQQNKSKSGMSDLFNV